MAHGDGREGKWRGNCRMELTASTLTLPRNVVYPALLTLMRTPRLPAVDWTDAPADLNGLVRFGERQNLVSARVPSGFKRTLLHQPRKHSFLHGLKVPSQPRLRHCPGFTTTFGRTPPDEWSARRRDLYLKTHNTHKRQTFVLPGGIRTRNPSMNHALDRVATGIGSHR